MINLIGGSKLLNRMSMLSGQSQDDMYSIFPAIPTKFTIYNIYSGQLEMGMHGYPVLNGGLFPRLCDIIGESATGKTTIMVGLATSAVDYIRRRFGDGYSELIYLDVEKNLNKNRFCDVSHWSTADYQTRCSYSCEDISLVDLANLIMKLADLKLKYKKDYLLPSGLRDIDGKEVMFLAPTYICVDSVAAINPNGVEDLIEHDKAGEMKDLDKIGTNMEAAQDAKAWTIFVRKIKPWLDKANIGLYCINHKTKEMKVDMFSKETRYLPFLGMGEKLKGGKELIFQSYNIFDLQSGEKFDDKNPVYGNDIRGFSTRASFVKSKTNMEGVKFPMVFDLNRGYLPELSDFEYLYQKKYGLDGAVKMSLDILPEITFTRRTLLDTIEEYPQLARAIQFTAKFHASNEMLYHTIPGSLKDMGTNVPLEQRLSILYNFTSPYERDQMDDPFKNFASLAQANRHYYTFGNNFVNHTNDLFKNSNVDQAAKGYTFVSTVGVTPYDADKGLATVENGHYAFPVKQTNVLVQD